MKKVIFLIVIVLFLFFPSKNPKEENIFIENIAMGDSVIKVEIAISEEEKKRGLSGRKFLPENQGLLFVFDKSGFYSFWMKDMNFPIDIVWLGNNLEIIDMGENLGPETYPQTFFPQRPAKFVLEVNAGWIKRHNIKLGMTAKVLSAK